MNPSDDAFWPDGVRAGFLLASRLAGDDMRALSSVVQDVRNDIAEDHADGRELAKRVRRRPSAAQLEDANLRAATILAAALPKRARVGRASTAPRRGYTPPAGLLETLLAFPSSADRDLDCKDELACIERLMPYLTGNQDA